jgi:dephospho-CoA kinase
MNQRIIGLTGGIATGKSTVSAYLASHYQFPIFDADDYARVSVAEKSPILQAIAHHFGQDILYPDGTLNRGQLGSIVFQDINERRWLEQQIHPFVRDRFQAVRNNTVAQAGFDKPLVFVIPLLFEAQMTDLVTEVWVVACTPEQQLKRLIHRNSFTPDQAQARITSQMPLAQKCDRADVILDNSTHLENLYQQIDRVLQDS